MQFSVLMSVYKKEKPEYLKRAIESVINQTLQPSEIVIVKDGKLTDELDKVLDLFSFRYLDLFKVISIPEHVGLGKALAKGVLNCSYEIIVRMDSDDISHPERFEKQISFLAEHPEIDVVGSWITEFDGDEDNICVSRETPITHDEIKKFARKRSPMNHMTVIFRKKAVLDAGNYMPLLWFEDYYLWVRMLLKGAKFANLPYYLVNVRAGKDMIIRRRGIKYALNEVKLQKRFFDMGFISFFGFIRNATSRFILRMLPPKMIWKIYSAALRKSLRDKKRNSGEGRS